MGAGALAFFLALASHTVAAQTALPSDSAIRTILRERVDGKRSSGLVVGVIDATGAKRVIAYGVQGAPGSKALDGNTVFEIGSVTKVFTTAILADMVNKGEVRLEDPAGKYLPASVKMPVRGGKQITLLDLATHTSGLPRLPTNMKPADQSNPYADYTVQQMYDFLNAYKLPRDIGAQYEYSNFGMGLVGHVLALRAGKSYEALVTERVLAPLGMRDSRITLTSDLRARLAAGHDESGKVVPSWDLPTLAGAGALRSTVNDMLKFLAANLDTTVAPVARALRTAHAERRGSGTPNLALGLGWHISMTPGARIVWHNGGTAGYHSFIGFDETKHIGVVVLSNSAASIDDIGRYILNPALPLAKPPVVRKEITIDSKLLDACVGEYEYSPAFHIVVTKEGSALYAQATGQSKLRLYAESPTEFFFKDVDAQVTFMKDASGKVTQAVLHQNGFAQLGRRVK
jgi:CubicO group peptidase (beta-lactamase class C family)